MGAIRREAGELDDQKGLTTSLTCYRCGPGPVVGEELRCERSSILRRQRLEVDEHRRKVAWGLVRAREPSDQRAAMLVFTAVREEQQHCRWVGTAQQLVYQGRAVCVAPLRVVDENN